MQELIKAIVNVMKECPTIDKNSEVGLGQNAYKAVKDSDLKLMLSKSMAKNGLCIIPKSIVPTTTFREYKDSYGKDKREVFTEVHATYRLMHESGQEVEIQGVGHGVDSQDKSIGKAMTYALKYAMLYTFMVSSSNILDSDSGHTDSKRERSPREEAPAAKIKLDKDTSNWKAVCNYVVKYKDKNVTDVIKHIETKYELSAEITNEIKALHNNG